jgi:glutathione S-transferase
MKLYMHAAACSLAPHIICRELGLPLELVEVDRKTNMTPLGEDYLQINGNGYVPALQLDSGEVLIEGPAIMQYLADLRPEAGLAPEAGTMERVRLQSWLNFITSELHKPLAMMFLPPYASARDVLRAHVNKRLDWMNGRFAGPYLMGEAFTVADPYLFVCLNWSPWHKIEVTRWPALADFMKRIAERPSVREAFGAEDLLPFGEEGLFYGPRAAISRAAATQATAARP